MNDYEEQAKTIRFSDIENATDQTDDGLKCNASGYYYARKQNASRVFAIVWASVRLSVCPSVTLVSCIKTVQARITKSSPWTAPRSLVYRDKISCH